MPPCSCLLPLSAEEGKVRVVQLVVDGVLHDVLDHRGPPRHLVGLLGHAVLATGLPYLATVALKIIKFENLKNLKF